MRLLGLLVLLYCILQAHNLPLAWLNTPHLKGAWAAFLIWSLPLIGYGTRSAAAQPLFAAVAATLLGVLGSLNALKYAGLALALLAFVPQRPGNLFWLATAIGWMPASAYLARELSTGQAAFARLLLVSIGSAWELLLLRRKSA